MTKVLTSLELYVIVQELKGIQGAKVNKIYQPDSHTLVFHFFKTGGHKFVLKIDSGMGMHLTTYSLEYPQAPPTFCMFLRKYLNNSELLDVTQKELERIIEFSFRTKTGKLILICELFSKGNFVLTDENYKIINSAAVQIWKDRTIKRGETYKYPPQSGFNLLDINKHVSLTYHLSANEKDPIVNFLAKIGFGSLYAEEICARAKVRKDKQISMLTPKEESEVVNHTNMIIDALTGMKISPNVFYAGEEPVEATPGDMTSLDTKAKKVGTFNEALDILYMTRKAIDIKSETESQIQGEKDRIERIVETQEKSLEEYKEMYEQNKKFGDLIYEHYGIISKIIKTLKDARDADQSWYDIYTVVEEEKEQGIEEAQKIKKLYPEDETILLDIGSGLKLDLRKSLEDNAETYYTKAKKAKAKIDGAKGIVESSKQNIDDLEKNKEKAIAEIDKKTPKPKEIVKKEWYEKFRWFFTPSGLLAIGGKDATQNEILIKKYLELRDVVFHTEMPGSPFFIIKEGREKATQEDLQEVSTATASYSKAWKLGIAAADVFYVRPEQVTKDAPGTYLPKGSFVVTGKRNYFRNTELKVAVGITSDGGIIGGPIESTRKYSQKMIQLKQGQVSKTDTAKKIAHELNVSVDDVITFLPSGKFQIY